MDPATRRWWLLLDQLPQRLGAVAVWRDSTAWPPIGDGHMHPNPTAVICLSGVLRISRPGQVQDLQAGEGLLIAPGIWHHHESPRAGAISFGQGFLPAWSDVILRDHERTWSGKLPSQPSRRLFNAAFASDDPAERCRLVADLVRQVLNESVTDLTWDHPALGRMVHALWRSLHLGVTTDDLVRASGLGRTRAYDLFTRGYGVTPKEGIAISRLWLAESLLRSGLPVADVAERCGYASADTFARCWRREHGVPPSRSR